MKQRLKNLFSGDGLSVGTILLVSLAIISPVIFFGIPFGNRDFIHHLQISNAFYESLRQGSWFPIWVFEENAGYGAVTVRFYPPLMNYSLAIFRCLLGDWQWAIFAGFSLWSFVGGLGIYVWTREFFAYRGQATAAAVLFVLSPYHLNQFFNSFMYGEFAALSVMPFAFYFARQVCRRGNLSDVLGLATALALIVLSNLPQAIVSAIGIGVYVLLNAEKSKIFNQFAKLFAAGLLALLCSSFYLVRLISEMNWINVSQPNTDPAYDFQNHFLLENFVFDSGGVWFASVIFVLSTLLCVTAFLLTRKLRSAWQNKNIRDVLLLSLLSVFMVLPLSRILWEQLAFLQKIQFPWRFLSIVTVGASVLAAFSLEFITLENWRRKRPLILLLVGAILIFTTFSVKQVALGAWFLEAKDFPALLEKSVSDKGLWHWQTVWSNEKTFDEKERILVGSRQSSVSLWEAERREFSVEAGEETEARIAVLYYPHWRASINGSPTEVLPSADGAIRLDLPPKKSEVKLVFVEPQSNLIAGKISIAVWSIIILLLLYQVFSKLKSA